MSLNLTGPFLFKSFVHALGFISTMRNTTLRSLHELERVARYHNMLLGPHLLTYLTAPFEVFVVYVVHSVGSKYGVIFRIISVATPFPQAK